MMEFRIIFDNCDKVYQPDGPVSGRLVVHLDEPKRAKGIYVKIFGEARVHWSEDMKHSGTQPSYKYHEDSETCVSETLSVFTPMDGSDEIPAGYHEYPFKFMLPPHIPSSFESKWSYVRYMCEAKIDRPWKSDHKVHEMFTVNAVLDMNANDTHRVGICQEQMIHRCCLWCESGPITAQLKLPRSAGYVPGERIDIEVSVDNSTDEPVPSIMIQLIQKIKNKTLRRRMSEDRSLFETCLPAVSPNQHAVYDDVHVLIPPVPPTNLGGRCEVIEVHYILTATIDPGPLATNMQLSCEITIGTIPLLDVSRSSPDKGGETSGRQNQQQSLEGPPNANVDTAAVLMSSSFTPPPFPQTFE